MIVILAGQLCEVDAKGRYVCPASYNPSEWVRAGYLRSFGLYDNFGYPWWHMRSYVFLKKYRVCFGVLRKELL